MDIGVDIKKCSCGSNDFHLQIDEFRSKIICNECGENYTLYESSLYRLIEFWNSYIGE